MTRARGFSPGGRTVFSRFQRQLFLDFGSVNTKVILGEKVVYEEPTCVSLHKHSGVIVAVGQRALSSWKKTPKSIETIFPIQMGVVAHQEAAEQYLEHILRERIFLSTGFFANLEASFMRISGKYAVGTLVSPVEKQVLQNVLKNVGLGGLREMKKTQALYERIHPKNVSRANFCSLDIGGQTTELGIFVEGVEVFSQTFYWGGFMFTERIRQIVVAKHQVEISWDMAESIKKQIGQVFIDEKREQKLKESQFAVRGKDISQNLVKTLMISAADFASDFLEISQEFADELRLAFDAVPGEIITQALNNGFFLTGGGSKLKDLNTFLQNQFKCDVAVSKTPELDIVKGLAFANALEKTS